MTPQTTLAGLPPTDSLDKDQFSWEDVVPAGAEPSFWAALGNQQPNAVADKTSQNLRLARPDDDPSQVTLPGAIPIPRASQRRYSKSDIRGASIPPASYG
ncbi:hypothetical protein PtA15_16A140 [Puccinia triticina]|uniref:Uncharacterized protein n=1 Tax=Puccinia triticina TaxID=208348 RepID=A0ABY7D3N9_9BASI|nr:uncharacterized protein PtA15_16A140 [Puccinia triticina]WAQ92234.1 hypothetical protein PtA15_16A140 [Puccinia triticina]